MVASRWASNDSIARYARTTISRSLRRAAAIRRGGVHYDPDRLSAVSAVSAVSVVTLPYMYVRASVRARAHVIKI